MTLGSLVVFFFFTFSSPAAWLGGRYAAFFLHSFMARRMALRDERRNACVE